MSFGKWKNKEIRRWEGMLQKGLGNFILYRGVLLWGISLFIIVSLLCIFFSVPWAEDELVSLSPLIGISCLILGALWSVVAWYFTKWSMGRISASQDEKSF
jgi:hypothetical protein